MWVLLIACGDSLWRFLNREHHFLDALSVELHVAFNAMILRLFLVTTSPF